MTIPPTRGIGRDVLLDAYFAEFTPEDDVTLVLRAFKPKHVKGTAVKNNQGWYDMTQKKYNLDIERMPENVTEHVAVYAMETTGKALSELPRVEWIAETLSKEGATADHTHPSAKPTPVPMPTPTPNRHQRQYRHRHQTATLIPLGCQGCET